MWPRRWEALADAGGSNAALAWLIGAAAVVTGSVVLVLRARSGRQRRGSSVAAVRGRVWRAAATKSRDDTLRLLRRAPNDAVVRWRWAGELVGPEAAVPEKTMSQARALGPWSWLAWSAHGGEIALPGLLSR